MSITRRYLMCRPTHFAVTYRINPWMDPTAPYDNALAVRQWDNLREIFLGLGHTVDLIEPLPGLPDMVFAANGGTVVDGRVLGVQFRDAERADEAPAYAGWFREHGFEVREPKQTNEGEGDILLAGDVLLAGTGFRTAHASHAETQEFLQRPVITLQLVDPAYYHLDTALCVLDEQNIAYLPQAFSPGSQSVLRQLFPNAIIATPEDAAVLGLNAVSDGETVVLPSQAVRLAADLNRAGYKTIGVDLSELRKAGGGPKCCTLEVRS
ncbi:dimethylargininase [Actinoplanes derwentensis]|uniref:N-Dimethylarginine dimethylaminohydrolase n=1 Tax=Actinoplanes derwentensis TaxID=113562 RepID=A0A1H2D2T6_9ACTN|nr:dimethylargininase [Actinoplanes derwentensis]GID88278.1 amidinotransferase [Actinoplanes derwentensis]SDT77070.1 N-Dimethylarginine dimethylaminohydrolase [Actinoplanes derwentensis]